MILYISSHETNLNTEGVYLLIIPSNHPNEHLMRLRIHHRIDQQLIETGHHPRLRRLTTLKGLSHALQQFLLDLGEAAAGAQLALEVVGLGAPQFEVALFEEGVGVEQGLPAGLKGERGCLADLGEGGEVVLDGEA
jgi:hypothetical protein